MNNRVIRGFFGSFLGTFMAIWPAATLDVAWLVLPGALLGWLLGYHGDRVGSGLVRGLKQTGRAVPQHMRTARDVTFVTGVYAGGWVVNHLRLPVDGLAAAGTYAMRAIRWCSHPMNHADVIRLVTNMVTGAFIIYGLVHIPMFLPLGSTVDLGNIPVGLIPFVLMPIVYGMLIVLASLIIPLVIVATTFGRTRSSLTMYYREWERYSRFKLLYPVFVASSFVYMYVWTMALMTLFISGVGITLMAVMIYGLLMASYYLSSFAARFTWRTIRYNRDYGLVSLVVAILVGSLTFMSERADLVADPMYRLMVASTAGLLAGVVSIGVMYVVGVVFMASRSIRRFAFHPPKFSSFFNPLWNWRKNGRDLPDYYIEVVTDAFMKRAPRYLSA